VQQLGRGAGAVASPAMQAEVSGRDRADTTRTAGPLRRATDAHVIDTGQLGIEAMVERALALCAEAGLSG
jgi:cytidylate kinase